MKRTRSLICVSADVSSSKQLRNNFNNNSPSTSKTDESISMPSDKLAEDLPPQIAKHIEIIKKMREKSDAPVDTMGCHMLADSSAEPKVYRFQTLIALMLSSQTKDQVTAAAMECLRNHGCTIDNLLATPQSELEKLICPVSFYKRKTEHIQRTAAILKEKFDSDIPDTIEGLTSLPGVGPKMGHLALQIAFNKNVGIGVDTHVHRIVNRLRWVKTKTPNETEKALTKILPRDHWRMINKLLVGFGQQICKPIRPKCSECLNRDYCPSVEK